MRLTALCLIAAGAAVAACAPTPAPSTGGPSDGPRACFSTPSVTNFRAGDTDNLYLRTSRGEVFELESRGFCQDLDWANSLTIQKEFVGGSRLCVNDDAVIGYRSGSPAASMPCRARVARQLTAEQVAALPSRSRP
ncbi:MAG: hypothetical protein KF910_13180 [Brevundimonas sp.]|uniref:DUF6491 family protein n=1 Tax=Brevundimonas sp. TaxID=1871086 RepID=UPI0025C46263|nr:DUF6491 family protein [Brevundimonas sp.]MBX3478557.1 hypothetical protein [Brevundimonas sp.]